MRHLTEAGIKLTADVVTGRKRLTEAIKEYRQEKQRVESERRMDEYRKY